MDPTHVIAVDLAKVYRKTGNKFTYLTTLAWGDAVQVEDVTPNHVVIHAVSFDRQPDGGVKPRQIKGYIRPSKASGKKPSQTVLEAKKSQVLKVDFIDVQQGDGSVIETPDGKVILIDGGDNQLFARYLAARFAGTSGTSPQPIECILVSHGDADHFLGLTEIHQSEKNATASKRLFMQPLRVFHNGLVKRPSKVGGKRLPDSELLGATKKVEGEVLVTDLVEDLLKVPDREMNKPFREWKAALSEYQKRAPLEFRRLQSGDDQAFDFMTNQKLKVEVLGPLVTKVGSVRGLKFLGSPKPNAGIGEQPGVAASSGGLSASHTINGHSVLLRLTYGDVRFLFAGDLNEESEETLLEGHRQGELDLTSDIFKVPHHGSADYSREFLEAVSPIVSVVSSGDESARKEYIHPRATLMAALGKSSRGPDSLVFVTELVAFFQVEGLVQPEFHELKDGTVVLRRGKPAVNTKAKKPFFGFSRAAFGMVKVRTDGKRILIWTNSGQTSLKEAYAFDFVNGKPKRSALVRA